MVTNATNTPIPNDTNIRVRIWYSNENGVSINWYNNREPSSTLVRDCMSDNNKATIANYVGTNLHHCTVRECIHYTRGIISFQDWADACALAIFKTRCMEEPADAIAPTITKPPVMVIDNTMYRLYPVHTTRLNTALKIARTKIMQDAEARAAQLETDAKKAADAIIKNANKLKEEYEKAYASSPPAWAVANGIPVWYSLRNQWFGVFTFDFYPKFWVYKCSYTEARAKEFGLKPNVYYWVRWKSIVPLNNRPKTCSVSVCIPLGGALNITALRMLGNTLLPHLTSKGCMSLGDAPKTMDNYEQWIKLTGGLVRAMNEEVNMASLLSHHNYWPTGLLDIAPEPIRKQLIRMVEGRDTDFTNIKPDHVTEIDLLHTTLDTWNVEE